MKDKDKSNGNKGKDTSLKSDQKASKSPYQKPSLKTEELTAIAALCNGSASGGRKASTGSPDFCQSSKLKS